VGDRNIETVKAILASAQADYSDEVHRAGVLDTKLANLAGFAGVSLSISAVVGGSVVVGGALRPGFLIAVGGCLAAAAILLLATVVASFLRLSPQDYPGLAEQAGRDRVTERRLTQDPGEALTNIAATYYLNLLPEHRALNLKKARRLRAAYLLVALGFGALTLALLTAVVGAVV
jgi:hypothetical protein